MMATEKGNQRKPKGGVSAPLFFIPSAVYRLFVDGFTIELCKIHYRILYCYLGRGGGYESIISRTRVDT